MHGSIIGGLLSNYTGGLVGSTSTPQSITENNDPNNLMATMNQFGGPVIPIVPNNNLIGAIGDTTPTSFSNQSKIKEGTVGDKSDQAQEEPAGGVTDTPSYVDKSGKYNPPSPSKWNVVDAARSGAKNMWSDMEAQGGKGAEGDKDAYQQLYDLRNGGIQQRAIGDLANGISGNGWSF